MRANRGFTLIELMIASLLSTLVAIAGFLALTTVQTASATQQRAVDWVSQGRLAMELMGRDIRSAGDSVNLLPTRCRTFANNASTWGCMAILDPHPWRIAIARNSWTAGADGVANTLDDAPDFTTPFADKPQNVVAYEFRPVEKRDDLGAGRAGYLGSLVRIENPYGFGGSQPVETVLLDHVLLDNRMRTQSPTAEGDARFHYAMFMYQVLSTQRNEFNGATELVDRGTANTTQGSFLLPPMRFYPIPADADALATPSWTTIPPNYGGFAFVGLQFDASEVEALRSGSTAADAASDVRFLLENNRVRAVRVAFKVVAPREDPNVTGGVELDPASPGTAPVFPFEGTFELKVFSNVLR